MPDSRLHIAHVVLSLQPGGLENGVVNVVNGLDPRRFRSSVVCLKEAGAFAKRITAKGTAIHELHLQPGNDPVMPFRLARWLRLAEVDLVHTRNAEPFFYGCAAAKLARTKHIVHSEHGRTFDDRPARFWLQRVMTRHADAVFAVSAQLRADVAYHVGIDATRIEVVHNGVDLNRFDRTNRNAARAELGIHPESVAVGSVGRLVPVKNYSLLLRALSDPALRQTQTFLIGDGPERPALEALVRSLGMQDRVRLLGHRDDVSALLAALDIFVLPSVSEGMSNTLLEAMACAVAPVVSDVGGNVEIVRDAMEGLSFPSGDEAALRLALSTLCADPVRREQIGLAARQRVLSDFDLHSMIQRYESMYERVALPVQYREGCRA